jgi:hypothetical protein
MKKSIYLLFFLFQISYSFSQYYGNERDTLDCNKIKAIIHPRATQFYDSSSDYNSFFYPADSTLCTLFTQGIWIGGLSEGDTLHLAAERYRQVGHDFWSGPYTNPSNLVVANEYFKTWKISKEQIIYHSQNYANPSYEVPEVIESWPAHGDLELGMAANLAEYIDVNENGFYDPENGDYPLIKGDLSVFYMINDNQEHTETGGRIMGVEIQCMAWAYDSDRYGDAYDHSIFMSYKVINRSNKDYHDTYIGVFTDFDIGDAHDDFIGCNVENGYFYAYNGDDYDTYYRDTIPVQASVVLSGPFMNDDGIDNPLGMCDESINGSGFGDGLVDNERMGLNRFVSFTNGWNPATYDPQNAQEYYSYLKGIWVDGTDMIFGGNGHIASGAVGPKTRFLFPGESDPCHWGTDGQEPNPDEIWTEVSAGNLPEDRRGLASMGPFTFEAGSTEYIDLVLVTAPYTDEKSNIELMEDFVSEIKQDYLQNPMGFGDQYVGINEADKILEGIIIFPNPTSGEVVHLEINEYASYAIHSLSGQLLFKGSIENSEINISKLNRGIYILNIHTPNKTYTSKLIKL